LTHSGRLTHKVVTRQPWIRRRSGKVRRLQTDILTTEPRRRLYTDETIFTVAAPSNSQNDRVYAARDTPKKQIAAK